MEVHINKELMPEIKSLVVTLKFEDIDEFVNKAIRDKILELKKKSFIEITNKVSSGLEKSNINEQEMLKEFERNR